MIIIVMGVTGSGKTTVGEKLAERLGWTFRDSDEFHPQANIDKMSRGIGLNDADRQPWLDAIGEAMRGSEQRGASAVIACSALKRKYRDQLRGAMKRDPVWFVYLEGDRQTLEQRLRDREHHFAPVELLDSQFDALEPPGDDERAVRIDITKEPDAIVDKILQMLERSSSASTSSQRTAGDTE